MLKSAEIRAYLKCNRNRILKLDYFCPPAKYYPISSRIPSENTCNANTCNALFDVSVVYQSF